MWNFLQSNEKYSDTKTALNVLTSLLNHPSTNGHKTNILHKCIKCLEDGISVPQSLSIMSSIFMSYPIQTRKTGAQGSSKSTERRSSWFGVKSKSIKTMFFFIHCP